MKRTLLTGIIGLMTGPQFVLAQGGAPLEAELDIETVIVVMPVSDSDSDLDAEPLLGELSLNGGAEKVLE
ncbi:MAG: hypothetical protein VX599_07770, partial [Pseudomonadota bacterium]|nr:hypothetical protein [Pseudomonadota bacterium]